MPGRPQTPDASRRIARFALASLLLHAALLLVLQFAADRAPSPPAEAPPVQMVDLQSPQIAPIPAPTPDAPDREPPAIVAPAPPRAPAEEERAAETPRQPPAPRRDAGAVTMPPGVVIPGLLYDGGAGDLADFGHAMECADIDLRHEDACADIGPIYVAQAGPIFGVNVPRVTANAEAEGAWAEQKAREALRDAGPMDPTSQEFCGPNFACVPDVDTFRSRGRLLRDGPLGDLLPDD